MITLNLADSIGESSGRGAFRLVRQAFRFPSGAVFDLGDAAWLGALASQPRCVWTPSVARELPSGSRVLLISGTQQRPRRADNAPAGKGNGLARPRGGLADWDLPQPAGPDRLVWCRLVGCLEFGGVLSFAPPPRSCRVWSLAEAKSQLSEIFRLAEEEGPQHIGTDSKTYFVVSSYTRREAPPTRQPLGEYLVANLRGLGELKSPVGEEPSRPIPFNEEGEEQ